MSVKQLSHRSLAAWYVVVALVLGVIFASEAASPARAKWQDLAAQDKDKKDAKPVPTPSPS